ncbi:CaiB/BaiF CoA transferase family protein [Arthrobacter pigmenti]
MATEPSALLPATAEPDKRGALAGMRVLEIGTLVAGPFAGRLLGDMGAEVIKIEAPGKPDPLRTWGQAEEAGHHFFWTVHARNKSCITLDLRSPQGQEIFLELVERSDVIVESFRPGTLEKWSLGYDVLAERNSEIILARVSGYGQTGPKSHEPGYASVAEAVSGIRYLNGYPDQPPPRLALSVGDSLGGIFAVQGVLAALVARSRTGRGQIVDAALSEACLAITESVIPDYDVAGHIRQPSGTRLEGIAPSNLYEASDGTWVIIAANQDTLFARLCALMGQPEMARDERFATHVARGRNQNELDDIIADWAKGFDAEELLKILSDAGVVCGPVNNVADVVQDDQFQFRDMLINHFDERMGRNVLGPGVTPKLSSTPSSVRWAGPPKPGSHNTNIYSDLLGYSSEQLENLTASHVI